MSVIDNSELNDLMEILENASNEQLAVSLLAEFNAATKAHGTLLMNKEQDLDHEEWKKECDKAKLNVDNIIGKIRSLQE